MADLLRQIVRESRAGRPVAIPSVCSAHPDVIRPSLSRAATLGRAVVVEATSNQVNQDGGYTGQRPAEFIAMVRDIAANVGLDPAQLVFGGDHLGPQAWRRLDAEAAMAKADRLVRDYVAAGFGKIHLDCSEGLPGRRPGAGRCGHRRPLGQTGPRLCRDRRRQHRSDVRDWHRGAAARRCPRR